MKINAIDGYTRVLGAPVDWDHTKAECVGLPIRDTQVDGIPCMASSWQPTLEEIGRIMAGAAVELWVCGTRHPPVSIQVPLPR